MRLLTQSAAFAAQPALNLNADGSPLTYSTAKKGPNTTHWQDAEDTEISRLIDSVVMHARHPHEQPADRKKDTTYYNPQTKEKDTDAGKTYRIRGTIGGDRINYTGVTKANTAAMPVVKMLLQSVVSDDAEFMTIDIKDFYLNTELPRSEWMRIPVKFLSAAILDKHNLRPFINDGAVIFEVVKSLYGLPHAGKISQDGTSLPTDIIRPRPLVCSATIPTASPSRSLSMISESSFGSVPPRNTSSTLYSFAIKSL